MREDGGKQNPYPPCSGRMQAFQLTANVIYARCLLSLWPITQLDPNHFMFLLLVTITAKINWSRLAFSSIIIEVPCIRCLHHSQILFSLLTCGPSSLFPSLEILRYFLKSKRNLNLSSCLMVVWQNHSKWNQNLVHNFAWCPPIWFAHRRWWSEILNDYWAMLRSGRFMVAHFSTPKFIITFPNYYRFGGRQR